MPKLLHKFRMAYLARVNRTNMLKTLRSSSLQEECTINEFLKGCNMQMRMRYWTMAAVGLWREVGYGGKWAMVGSGLWRNVHYDEKCAMVGIGLRQQVGFGER